MASRKPQDRISDKSDLINLLDQLSKQSDFKGNGQSGCPLTETQAQQLATKLKKILKSQLN
jgi:hypothetical protein